MNEGIRVMRKSELRTKKTKFLCVVGLELGALPVKEPQAFKDSTLCTKYSINEIIQIFHSQYAPFRVETEIEIKEVGSLCIQESFFELRFQKIEAILVQIFHIQKKPVLFSQNSQTRSAH